MRLDSCNYAMLALVLAVAVLSKGETIKLVVGMEASFDLFYIVLQRHSGIYKNRGTFLRNFS